MKKVVVLRETQGPYRLAIDDEALAHEPVILERDGRPLAVIVPIAEYEALRTRYEQRQQEIESRLYELEERQARLEARATALEEKLRRLLTQAKQSAVRDVAIAG
ncbi:MAG: type II toxin-antitoxin system prevent-host-death family antitoxin [Anaerolineae bacterium]